MENSIQNHSRKRLLFLTCVLGSRTDGHHHAGVCFWSLYSVLLPYRYFLMLVCSGLNADVLHRLMFLRSPTGDITWGRFRRCGLVEEVRHRIKLCKFKDSLYSQLSSALCSSKSELSASAPATIPATCSHAIPDNMSARALQP